VEKIRLISELAILLQERTVNNSAKTCNELFF